MARLRTRKVVPQTVPDEDFILDDIGDASLDVREFLCVGFVLFCFFSQKSVFWQKSVGGQTARVHFQLWMDLRELRCAGVMPVVDVR